MKKKIIICALLCASLLCGCNETARSENRINYLPIISEPGSRVESSPAPAESSEVSDYNVAASQSSEPEPEIDYNKFEETIPDAENDQTEPFVIVNNDIIVVEGEPYTYDRNKALEYAKNHWNTGVSYCAEFASECLNAGGFPAFSPSSTRLYEMLRDAKLGTMTEIPRNEDGSVTMPEYAVPGDLVFYICDAEELMVHTVVYNGTDENGLMKAYSHNPRNNGQETYIYYRRCTSDCGWPLKSVMLYHFSDDVASEYVPEPELKPGTLGRVDPDKKSDTDKKSSFRRES